MSTPSMVRMSSPLETATTRQPKRDALGAAFHGIRWLVTRYWGVMLLIIIWYGYVALFNVSVLVIPSPGAVFSDLIRNFGFYRDPTISTLVKSIVGLVVGMLIGAVIAALSWFSRALNGFFTPVAVIIRSVPIVALIPVLARLFGYEQRTVFVITITISFFSAFVFLASGLRASPPGTEAVFAALGANRIAVFRWLAMPSAVPNGLIALRLSAADAVLAAIIAEFLMGTSGLGKVFQRATSNLDMLTAWSAAVMATIISVAFFAAARRVERAVNRRWAA